MASAIARSLSLSRLLSLLCLAAVVVVAQNPQNMNPTLKYTISNPAPGFEGKTYPFIGEYFEVETTPLRMQYGQVYWQTMPAVPLPDAIVKRYANANIAVTGFEVNVYRRNNATGMIVPVPAFESYNHHYSPNIVSSAVSLKLGADGQPMGMDSGHGKMLEFELREGVAKPPPGSQLNQAFVHGNGQEHRQIYHGHPQTYVQTIYSPGSFVLSPMQICTNDGTGRKGAAGMLPGISRSYAPPDAPYSPLLECPCTTRVKKELSRVAAAVVGQCPKPLLQGDCYVSAAQTLGYANIRANLTTTNATLPPGCLVQRVEAGGPAFNVVFNMQAQSRTPCQGAAPQPDPSLNRLAGSTTDLVALAVTVDGAAKLVTITMSGPAAFWFGVGFNASKMADLPYTIIVDGNGNVQERKLADHDEGAVLTPSLRVLNSSVSGGLRTVVLQRALAGLTADHYTFSPALADISFINALGSTVELAQHKARGAASLALFRLDTSPTCLCADGQPSIGGIPYDADCKPEPLSDLLRDNNPTCQVSSYIGGLACCFNGAFLLDADQQPPPFVDEIFFKFRFYYQDYNPAVHQLIHHVEWSLNGCDSGAGGPNPMACRHIEFDTVKGTGSQYGPDVQVFSSTFPAGGMLESSCDPGYGQCMDGSKVGPGGFKLIMAAAHCHAPNCLRQELVNVDTGETLCAAVPEHGKGDAVYDEAGYLFAPPCTWGSAEEGFLPPPVLFKNTTMRMTAFYNSTWAHPGQMGIWQMKAAYVV